MNKKRILDAGVIAVLASIILFLITFGSWVWLVPFCALGAFGATFILHQPEHLKFSKNLLAAVGIVLITSVINVLGYVFVGLICNQLEVVSTFFLLVFFWEIFLVSWWAIPLTACVLWVLNHLGRKKQQDINLHG